MVAVHPLEPNVDFETILRTALAAPPGSVMHAHYNKDEKTGAIDESSFELDSVNGQKPAEA